MRGEWLRRAGFGTVLEICQFIWDLNQRLKNFLQPKTQTFHIILRLPRSGRLFKLPTGILAGVLSNLQYSIITEEDQIIYKLMLSARQQSPRPRSSVTPRPHPPKKVRFNKNEELHTITSSIHQAFSRENRCWNEIKHLTTTRLDPKHHKTLDNLCRKYSIAHDRRKTDQFASSVDVDFLVKDHIKQKGQQQQRRRSRSSLKKEIRDVALRHQRHTEKPFFNINRDNLLSIVQKHKSDIQLQSKHPYMRCYQEQQREALACFTQGAVVKLALDKDYPPLVQAQQWEKQHARMRGIYSGVSHLRAKTAMLRSKRIPQQKIHQFFVTEQ